jgi:uncharacterized membrane protein YkvA (DUF1232 family)
MWWHLALGIACGLLLMWVLLLAVLWRATPERTSLHEALRLVPDVLRLLRRLAADPMLPRGVRIRLWLLLGYLAMPIDLIPDFIPVLGYADDVVVLALALRSVARRAARPRWNGIGRAAPTGLPLSCAWPGWLPKPRPCGHRRARPPARGRDKPAIVG